MLCPNCNYDNADNALTCTNCQADLYDTLLDRIATRKLRPKDTAELEQGSATYRPVVMYISGYDNPVAIERRPEIVIGRNEGDVIVEVDLTDYDAKDKGVSRRHVHMDAMQRPIVVIDLDSYNGTFINGEKLIPERPYTLKSGDELRMGRLVGRIYYK